MKKFKVQFYNPEKRGSGFIESYSSSARAKRVTHLYQEQYKKDGYGITAEYLGRENNTKE